jgi:hypothetical protein
VRRTLGDVTSSLPATLPAAGSGGTAGGLNIYIQAPVYGVDHMEDVVVRALHRASRRGRTRNLLR